MANRSKKAVLSARVSEFTNELLKAIRADSGGKVPDLLEQALTLLANKSQIELAKAAVKEKQVQARVAKISRDIGPMGRVLFNVMSKSGKVRMGMLHAELPVDWYVSMVSMGGLVPYILESCAGIDGDEIIGHWFRESDSGDEFTHVSGALAPYDGIAAKMAAENLE